MEATDSRVADSEATLEDVTGDAESSEGLAEDTADDAAGFIVAPRSHDVERLSDSESSPEADDILVDAAPTPSPPAASKQPKGGFADEEDLFT